MKLAVAGLAHPHVTYVLDEVSAVPGLELVGTSDPNALARERWTPKSVATFADHRELLERTEPDVVATFARYGDRSRIVVDALRAGAHVIADKPLCTSLDGLAEIAAATRDTGRTVSLLLEKRWHPVTLAARELISAGRLGEIAMIASTGPHKLLQGQRPDWFWHDDVYGHVLADLPVHDIDLALLLTGARQGTVAGRSATWAGARGGALLLTLADAIGTIDAHWLWPEASAMHGHYRMTVTGTAGVAELDWGLRRLRVTTHEQPTWKPALPQGRRPAQNALGALAQREQPEISTSASLLVTRVALLGAASAADGGNPRTWNIDDLI